MKKIILYILFVATAFTGFANNQTIIDSAEVCFSKGEYDKAINSYLQVIEGGSESSELYFNTGNAYYKSGQVTNAILYFERAQLLNPGDEDIKYNLELVNKHVVDKIEVLPAFFLNQWVNQARDVFSSDSWAVLSMVCFVSFLLLFLLFFFSRQVFVKKLSFWVGVVVLVISLTSFIFSYQQKQEVLNHNTAIIYTPSITIKSSPDASGTDIFLLHEGTKVTVVDTVGEWREIKLSDGNEGWLKALDIVMI